MADRERVRAAILARLERATPDDNFALVLEPSALAESRLLGDMLQDNDGDYEGRFLLGWLHLYRYYALPAGQDQEEYDAAVDLFAQCFVADSAELPASLLPAIVGRAVATARSLLDEALDSADPELAAAAAALWSRIAEATPAGSAARADRLSSLGVALQVRYGRTGVPADLDAAVQAGQAAVDGTPADDPDRVIRESHLSVAWLTRFNRTESQEDLEAGLQAARSVVDAVAPDDPDRAMYLSNLGAALKIRFDWTGQLTELDDVICTQQAAVAATAPDDPRLPRHLTNLAVAYHTRFQQLGRLADCDAAITAQRAAIEAAPPDHPDLPAMLSNLNGIRDERFVRTGEIADLDAAMEAGRDAVKATRDGHPGEAERISNLGNAVRLRFERTGRLADIDDAIRHHQDAVRRCAQDDRIRPALLSNLGVSLMARFERTGAMTDLDAAVEVAESAVAAVPDGHPDRARYLSNLGIQLQGRFVRARERGDLEAAIRAAAAAVDLTPAGRTDRAKYQSNLAIARWYRFEEDGSPADRDAVVQLAQAAVDATPTDHPDYPRYLTVLGIAHRASRSAAGLDQAIEVLRVAVDATPEHDLHWAGRLSQLGDALSARFEHSHGEPDRAAAFSVYAKAAGHDLALPPQRINAAREAAALAAPTAPETAAGLLESAVRLLGEAVPRALARADQQDQIKDFAGLASDAAALALTDDQWSAAERPAHALGLLEAGRAVLLSQILDTRDDLTDLRRQHPSLADRLVDLRERLSIPSRGLAADPVAAAPGQAAEERRRLADQLTATLEEIRAIEDFASFGLPPSRDELIAHAVAGPVVTVNVSAYRSDALMLTQSGITSVGLPGLTRDALTQAIRTFHDAVGVVTAGSAEYRDQAAAQRAMAEVLGWLWDVAAEPVLDTLGFREAPAGGAPWPRIWWATGGLLGLLPIHAAGYHADHRPGAEGPRTVMDRVISSYTPTIRALAYARQRPPVEPARALVVAMPITPGLPGGSPLPNVPAEIGAVRLLLPDPVVLAEPADSAQAPADTLPTQANVFRHLPQCAIGHFACHAASHAGDPSQSLLLLHDHETSPFTVSSLAPVQHDRLQLVYLSACRTAYTPDADLLDEAIHLTSAFQLAGSRHVIGTLWEIRDTTAGGVAASFYRGLRTGTGVLDADLAAWSLHDSVRAVRDTHPRLPSLWAAYLHVGA